MGKKHTPTTGTPERRQSLCEVRAEQDEQHGAYITGYPIVFNEVTDIGVFRESIDATAIDERTDMRDVRFLIGHNADMIPLARSRNNNQNSTMQLEKDAHGLRIRANLDTENNETAKALYSAAGRGDISGMSFMFIADADSWEDLDTDSPIRYIRHIARIYEVSAVAFPAYEGTQLEAANAGGRLDSLTASLESARARLQEEREKAQREERRKRALEKLRRNFK